jgi:hypothetical protein
MFGPHYIYDLPVHRLSCETYNKSMDEKIARQLDQMRRIPGCEPPQHVLDRIKQHQYEKFGPWRYNEAIGYIRLYILGTQVRGEYFSAEKSRNFLGRSKVFLFRSLKLAPEVEIQRCSGQLTNESIWLALQTYIARCRKELRKGRVIDDSLLNLLGPFMDWNALLIQLKR